MNPPKVTRGFTALRKMPRILVVHQDQAVVRFLREAFIWHRQSVLVEHARTADRARWHLDHYHDKRGRWLVMICAGMNHQDGFSLLEHLRSEPRFLDVPVVILTQQFRSQDEQRAFAIGADFVFVMPNTIDEYGTIVRCCRELLVLRDDDEDAASAG